MRDKKRVFMLIGLMILATGIVGTTAVVFLYRAAMFGERERLTEMVKSQGRLIEVIARHDMTYKPNASGGTIQATMGLIADTHSNHKRFGKTGAFALAGRVDDRIIFLLQHEPEDPDKALSVPWHSPLAQPMRLALSGGSGVMVGLDYRGKEVLAAYESVAILDLGIVAKIDLEEVRAPFVRAGLLAVMVILVVSIGGAVLFVRITRPMMPRVERHARDLEKTVAELEESEGRFRKMIERNPDAILILNRGGDILFANPTAHVLFGRPVEALMGVNLGLPIVKGEFSEISIAGIKGNERTAEMRSETIQWANEEAFIVTIRDVSEQRDAARRIRRLNEALRAIRDVNQLITREGDSSVLLQEACKILTSGNRFKDVWIALLDESRNIVKVVQAGVGPAFQVWSDLLETGPFPSCFKTIISGSHAVVMQKSSDICRNCPLNQSCAGEGALVVPLFQDNRLYGIMVMSSPFNMMIDEEDQHLFKEAADDIAFALKSIETEEKQRQVQESLRQSENRFRLLVENAPLGIFVIDKTGVILDANEKALEILRLVSAEGMVLRNILELPMLMDAGISDDVRRCLETAVSQTHERPCATEGGGALHLRYHLAPVIEPHDAVVGLQGIIEDISGTRNLECQLRQAQKMEAIGTLAGGIAHDFNNILAAILGYSQLLMEETPEDSPVYSYMGEILKAGQRARDLIKQILTFSRQTEAEPMPLKPHLIVKEAIKLLRSTIPTTIEIRQHVFPNTGAIMADPTQIHQVIMNLCTNAYQAMMETGGLLEITLQNVHIKPENVILKRCPALKAGAYVRLTVHDTGSGIGPHTMEHIFDPYFTTKEKGRGTGLGLSVVHGIVADCRGAIDVESELGKGTTFQVFFPSAEKKEVVSLEKSVSPIQGGNECILLVDDEPPIVNMVRQMLEKYGYRVETSTDSLKVLQRFSEAPGEFDLVITDMTMPNMSGDRLASEIMKIRPDFPVIICTGHSDLMDEEKAASLGLRAFLMKPLDRLELAQTVRAVLDA